MLWALIQIEPGEVTEAGVWELFLWAEDIRLKLERRARDDAAE